MEMSLFFRHTHANTNLAGVIVEFHAISRGINAKNRLMLKIVDKTKTQTFLILRAV